MSIKSESWSILKFIVEKKETNSLEIRIYFGFNKSQTRDALNYLQQKSLIHFRTELVKGIFMEVKATHLGIDYVKKSKLEEQQNLKKILKPRKETTKREMFNQLSRIETTVKSLQSRPYREITYKASFYPIIIASFIAIGFSSTVQLAQMMIKPEMHGILMGTYYFIILICMWGCAALWSKMRKNLDVDKYVILMQIKEEENKFNLLEVLRKIFENNEHQLFNFEPSFEGTLLNKLEFLMRSRKTDIKRKEAILKENFNKKIEKVDYEFNYVGSKNVYSSLIFDFKNSKIQIELDRSVDFQTAQRIYKEILKGDHWKIIDKSGWDH